MRRVVNSISGSVGGAVVQGGNFGDITFGPDDAVRVDGETVDAVESLRAVDVIAALEAAAAEATGAHAEGLRHAVEIIKRP